MKNNTDFMELRILLKLEQKKTTVKLTKLNVIEKNKLITKIINIFFNTPLIYEGDSSWATYHDILIWRYNIDRNSGSSL